MVKISVIIAAYNSENYIREAVASVQRQTLRELEILCVDDCSQDATPRLLDELAAEDSRVRVIHHTVNGGTAKSRYDGLCAASGEYILFLTATIIIPVPAPARRCMRLPPKKRWMCCSLACSCWRRRIPRRIICRG